MDEFCESDLSTFHYSAADGGLVDVGVDYFTGKYFVLFRRDWKSVTVGHSKDYESLTEANRVARTLVTTLAGATDAERKREMEASIAMIMGSPVNRDGHTGIMTIPDTENVYDGAAQVASLLGLTVDLFCAVNPNVEPQLSRQALDGLSYVLMQAQSCIETLSDKCFMLEYPEGTAHSRLKAEHEKMLAGRSDAGKEVQSAS
jgi:hypothetical protein